MPSIIAVHNYASALADLERCEEAKALLRRTLPVARRVLGDNHKLALKMRWLYAAALRNRARLVVSRGASEVLAALCAELGRGGGGRGGSEAAVM